MQCIDVEPVVEAGPRDQRPVNAEETELDKAPVLIQARVAFRLNRLDGQQVDKRAAALKDLACLVRALKSELALMLDRSDHQVESTQ